MLKKQDKYFVPEQSKFFLTNLYLLSETIKNSLLSKNIVVSELNFIACSDLILINANIFYRTIKLIRYRKRLKKKKILKKNHFKTLNFLNKIVLKITKDKLKKVMIRFTVLNLKLKKRNLSKHYKYLKQFLNILFNRGLNLFFDFIKMTDLFSRKLTSINSYLIILGKIFKVLHKKKHNKFIFFITLIFSELVQDSFNEIIGLRIVINGKLSGKTRASKVKVEKGLLNASTIDSNVCSSKIHVYTIYGVFGFRLWINYKK